MRRLCFADLKNQPDLIEACKVWRARIAPPAAVTRAIRAAGIAALPWARPEGKSVPPGLIDSRSSNLRS